MLVGSYVTLRYGPNYPNYPLTVANPGDAGAANAWCEEHLGTNPLVRCAIATVLSEQRATQEGSPLCLALVCCGAARRFRRLQSISGRPDRSSPV